MSLRGASEEYHDELYGHLEYRGDLNAYLGTQPQQNYIRLRRDGTTLTEQKCKTEIIRHQIHHPENTHNPRFTDADLATSIDAMRLFIQSQP